MTRDPRTPTALADARRLATLADARRLATLAGRRAAGRALELVARLSRSER